MKKQNCGKLHSTQEKLYKAIRDHGVEGLSLRDFGEIIDVKNANTVLHHLKQLEKKGYIIRDNVTKTITALKDPIEDIAYLNLYGVASCGTENFFSEDNLIEQIPMPLKHLKVTSDHFLIKASGDSMEPKIHDGDLVVVQKSESCPNDGDIILALDDGSAKIKKFYRGDNGAVLVSLNHEKYPESQFVSGNDFRCVGSVRGVFHRFNDFGVSKKITRIIGDFFDVLIQYCTRNIMFGRLCILQQYYITRTSFVTIKMHAMAKTKKPHKIGRDADTGKFIPVKIARRRKKTAVVETIKR